LRDWFLALAYFCLEEGKFQNELVLFGGLEDGALDDDHLIEFDSFV
jgi:hypothetical protein